jgi:hypothetical protein
MNQIDALEIVKKWAFLVPEGLREELSNYICNISPASFFNERTERELINLSSRLRALYNPVTLSVDSLLMGLLFFFGSHVVSLSRGTFPENSNAIFSLTALYVLLDHYIDDETISLVKRKETIRCLAVLIENPRYLETHTFPVDDDTLRLLKLMASHLNNILALAPNAEAYLKKAFYSEVVAMKLQADSSFDRALYLKLCEWKGGATCEVMAAILGFEVTNADYELGVCIQLVDDLIDVYEDIEANISTACTYDLERIGNLDNFFLQTLHRIDSMDNKNTIFKPLLIWNLLHSITTLDVLSDSLRELLAPYCLLKPGVNYKRRIYERLLSYISD